VHFSPALSYISASTTARLRLVSCTRLRTVTRLSKVDIGLRNFISNREVTPGLLQVINTAQLETSSTSAVKTPPCTMSPHP